MFMQRRRSGQWLRCTCTKCGSVLRLKIFNIIFSQDPKKCTVDIGIEDPKREFSFRRDEEATEISTV